MAPMQPPKALAPSAKSPKATPSPIRKKAGPRQPRTIVKKSNAKRRAKPYFAFLDLPGEVRNMIYDYALVDCDFTISIQYNKKGLNRRLMGRSDLYCRRWSDVPKEEREKSELGLDKRLPWKWRLNSQLSPELLTVCKQINVEATSFLYEKNYFLFLDTTAMDMFLHQCGSQIRLIRRIGLAYWDMEKSVGHQYSGFKKLTEAVNLEALILGKYCLRSMVRKGFAAPDESARTFHRVASSWLWYMAGQKGNKGDSLSLLFFSDEFQYTSGDIQNWQKFCKLGNQFQSTKEQEEEFRASVLAFMS